MINIFCDGASKGNPGISGCGFVVYEKNKEIFSDSIFLDTKTNNQAEYLAVIYALKYLDENNIFSANFFCDSQLIVNQLKGIYQIKEISLKKYFLEIKDLMKNKTINFTWIRREDNKRADELANIAIEKNFDNIRINKEILEHIFFGKITALKIQYCIDDENFYFQLGLKKNEKWNWKRVKMSLNEIGEIIFSTIQKEYKTSFFHNFKNNKTQIWINKSEKNLTIKIDQVSKTLSIGEIQILKIFLEKNLFLKK